MRELLYCLGASHTSAPIEIRERLRAIHDRDSTRDELFGYMEQTLGTASFVLLSTCNRIEIYFTLPQDLVAAEVEDRLDRLSRHIATHGGVTSARVGEHIYRYENAHAVEHLAKVACGLESLILGEVEVLGQVSRAFQAAREAKTVDTVLYAAFKNAISAGKRARSETAISRNPSSVGSAAVAEIRRRVSSLDSATIILLGAGEMGSAALDALKTRANGQTIVVNRSLERAQLLCRDKRAEAAGLEALPDLLSEADAVVCAAGGDRPLIDCDTLASRRAARTKNEELLLVDIGVPRNVSPECGEMSGVTLVDLDSLSTTVESGYADRERETPFVLAIVADAVERYERDLRLAAVRPTLREIRTVAEKRRSELCGRLLEQLEERGSLDPESAEAIERFSKKLVDIILHDPSEAVRRASEAGDTTNVPSLVREMLGMDRHVS